MIFKKKKKTPGEVFADLLREKTGDPNLWVPGVDNGAMSGVVEALSSLPDEEIVRIIRTAAASK